MRTAVAILVCCAMVLGLTCGGRMGLVVKEPIPIVELPKTGIPVVNIQILVKSGSADDPVGKEGLAQFTTSLMMRSSGKFSREDMVKRLQSFGARLDAKVDRETILFSLHTLNDKLDQAYEILADIVLNPAFPDTEAERVKSAQESDLEDIIRNDERLCVAVFENTLYSGHRYAHPVPGLRAAIRSFSPGDADSYYRSNFRSDNVVIGIAGDYPDGFAGKIRSDFEALPSSTVIRSRENAAPLSGHKVVLVEKENRGQIHFRIGNVDSYSRTGPEYYALRAANAYLERDQESFGRMLRTFRADRGLSYRAFSCHKPFESDGSSRLPCPFNPFNPTYHSISRYSNAVNAEFAMKLAVLEYSSLVKHGIRQDDLEMMKQSMINRFPLLYETPEKRLSLEIEQICYDDSLYIAQYPERVSRLTAEEVADAVRKHWSEESWLLVAVVSDGERFRAQLLDGQTEMEYPSGITKTDLDVDDAQINRFDLRLTDDDITVVNADKLFK